jgi:hypothetical protein
MQKASVPARPTAKMVGALVLRTPSAYEDASYGYDGYYVDVKEYQYYFREGFRRGYEDAYYSSQYGRYSKGTANIFSAILQTILNLQLVN